MGALSVTPNPKYQAPFAPLIPDVRVGELNDMDVERMNQLVDENTCGVIVEPIQGEGGVGASHVEWLQLLARRCREVGAVLIYDEIQVGGDRQKHHTQLISPVRSLPIRNHVGPLRVPSRCPVSC
jgi:acetylornithine aminotransferase